MALTTENSPTSAESRSADRLSARLHQALSGTLPTVSPENHPLRQRLTTMELGLGKSDEAVLGLLVPQLRQQLPAVSELITWEVTSEEFESAQATANQMLDVGDLSLLGELPQEMNQKRLLVKYLFMLLLIAGLHIGYAAQAEAQSVLPTPTAQPDSSPTETPTETPNASETQTGDEVPVETGDIVTVKERTLVILRTKPGLNGDFIRLTPSGTQFEVVDVTEVAGTLWIGVRPEGADESAEVEYTEFKDQNGESKFEVESSLVETEFEEENVTAPDMRRTTSAVNVRTAPNTDSEVVTTLTPNVEVEVIEELDSGWVKVRVPAISMDEETDLYMSADFLENVEREETSPAITAAEEVTATATTTETIDTVGQGGSVETENLLAEAQSVDQRVNEIKVGPNNPVALTEKGFPILEYQNGQWQSVELTAQELIEKYGEEGQTMIDQLPKDTVYSPDGKQAVQKFFNSIDWNQTDFSDSDLGVFASLTLDEKNSMVMLWRGGLEYRSDWHIPQIEGEKATIYLSSAYNSIHPVRDVMTRERGKLYVFNINNGTVEEATKSSERQDLYVDNQNTVEWYKDTNFINEDERPILPPENYNDQTRVDKMIDAFWNELEDKQRDGKVFFPKLNQYVDISKKINFSLWRFPDDEKGKVGWYESGSVTLPSHFYQIKDNTLYIDVTFARTGSHAFSTMTANALMEILENEFDKEPDWMDLTQPVFATVQSEIVDYIVKENPDGTASRVIILPFYLDAAEEKEMLVKPIN